MKAFFTILKCELLRVVSGATNQSHEKKKAKAKIGVSIAFIALLGAVFAAMSGTYSFLFAVVLEGTQTPIYTVLGVFLTLYLFFALTFSITCANGTVFGGSDYETTMSLPIRPIFVALAKSAYVYVFLLGLAIVLVLPSACVCACFSDVTIFSVLSVVAGIIFLPLLPLAIGLALGSAVAILMAKVKRKGIVRLIISAMGLAVYFFFLFGMNGDITDEQIVYAFSAISRVLAPICYLAKGFLHGGLALFVVVALPLALSALYYAFIAKWYKKINTLILTKRAPSNFKMKQQKQNSILKCTLKREFKAWAACPGAILNNAMGVVVLFALSIYAFIKGGITADGIFGEDVGVYAQEIVFYARAMVPFVPIFFVSVSTYPSSSVSLEGKSIWIMKSLPLSCRDFLKPKFILGLLISLPLTALAEIFLGAAFGCTFWEIIIALVFLVLYAVTANLFGLYVNLKMPFFDWKNPAEVIKRGGATSVCSLIGMVAIIPYGAIAVLCMTFLQNYYLAWALAAVLTVIFLSTLILLFYKNGEKLYAAL